MFLLFSLPVFLSSLLLAAHFYRAGIVALALCCLIIPFLLFFKHQLIPKIIVFFLVMTAAEWLRTMILLILRYQEMGYPWTRLAIILSSVALFSALSCLVFKTTIMKKRYSSKEE